MFRRVETIMLLALCSGVAVNANMGRYLSTVTWEDGRFGYFAVPKDTVRQKLEEMQKFISCDEARLTLPTRNVFPDILRSDQHVVAIVYGKLGAVSIEESLPAHLKAKYETTAETVQFFIPFLTGPDPDAKPRYKLALGSYVSTSKTYIQPNIAIPTEQVGKLEVRPDGLTVEDGEEVLNIAWSQMGECEMPDKVILHDFEEYINEFTLSFRRNGDFSFCDEPDAGNEIFCEYQRVDDCGCQFWTHGQTKSCDETFFSVTTITDKFKNSSLLFDGPQNAFMTEFNEGMYGIGGQKQCFE